MRCCWCSSVVNWSPISPVQHELQVYRSAPWFHRADRWIYRIIKPTSCQSKLRLRRLCLSVCSPRWIVEAERGKVTHEHADLYCCFSAALSAIYMRCGIWLVKKLTLWHEHILFDVFCCHRCCDCNNFHKSDILKSRSAFFNAKKSWGECRVHPRERGFDSICSQI